MFGTIYEICCDFHPAIGLLYAPMSPVVTAIVSRIFFAVMIRSRLENDDLVRESKNVTRGGMVKRLAWMKHNAQVLPQRYRILARLVPWINYSGILALAWALIIISGRYFYEMEIPGAS